MLQIRFSVEPRIVINAMLPSSFQGSLLLHMKKQYFSGLEVSFVLYFPNMNLYNWKKNIFEKHTKGGNISP